MAEKTKAQKQAVQFGNLELRAELEPYLAKNPLARLGYDIIERGEVVGEGPGGEIVAGLQDGPEGLKTYVGGQLPFHGIMLPSRRQDPNNRYFNTEDFPKKYGIPNAVLKRQGIMQLLPPEEGSTVYYETGDDDRKRGMDLNTLMEELAHLGMREVKRRGGMRDLPVNNPDAFNEEMLMDIMQGRAAESGGVTIPSQDRAYDLSKLSIMRENYLKNADRLASEILMERKAASRPKKSELSFFDKISDIFN